MDTREANCCEIVRKIEPGIPVHTGIQSLQSPLPIREVSEGRDRVYLGKGIRDLEDGNHLVDTRAMSSCPRTDTIYVYLEVQKLDFGETVFSRHLYMPAGVYPFLPRAKEPFWRGRSHQKLYRAEIHEVKQEDRFLLVDSKRRMRMLEWTKNEFRLRWIDPSEVAACLVFMSERAEDPGELERILRRLHALKKDFKKLEFSGAIATVNKHYRDRVFATRGERSA